MKAVLKAALLLAFALPFSAQAQLRPKADAPAVRPSETPSLDSENSQLRKLGDANRKIAEERERTWDRKMRDTVRSICTGC